MKFSQLYVFCSDTITADIMLKWQKTKQDVWNNIWYLKSSHSLNQTQNGLLSNWSSIWAKWKAKANQGISLITDNAGEISSAVAQSGSSWTPASERRNLRGIKQAESQWSSAGPSPVFISFLSLELSRDEIRAALEKVEHNAACQTFSTVFT